jgi:ribosomal protein L40E
MEIEIEIVIVLLTLLFVFYPFVMKTTTQSASPETDIEAAILKLRRVKNRHCPKCGSANPSDARFCSECATKLTKER